LLIILQELADTLGLFFLAFIFIFGISLVREALLQLFNSTFFKNYLNFLNKAELLSYFSHFFATFRLNVSVLIKKVRSFFNNRR